MNSFMLDKLYRMLVEIKGQIKCIVLLMTLILLAFVVDILTFILC